VASAKLGSVLKRLIGDAADRDDRPVNVLVQLRDALSPSDEPALRALGAQIRARAGDVLTMTVPLHHLTALAAMDVVVSIEASGPLYPEAKKKDT
jgi:hypothetical protein